MRQLILLLCLLVARSRRPRNSDTGGRGLYEVQPYGNDTTYMRAFTHRRVNGELRFLSPTHRGDLLESMLPGGMFGQKTGGHGRDWALGPTGALGDFTGIWWEQDKNRLWVSSGPDYTANYSAAHVTILTLSDTSSTATVVKSFYLRCQKRPTAGAPGASGARVVHWRSLRLRLRRLHVAGRTGRSGLDGTNAVRHPGPRHDCERIHGDGARGAGYVWVARRAEDDPHELL